ncbi:MAG: Virginiamycin B lyase [Methanocella sp. PtaU1.Bin125]|nr:MAG: Virginiamycin B lyase [Methanocella sp. PtaU1.Bin125]
MRRSGAVLVLAVIVTVVALLSQPALADAREYYPVEVAVDGSGNVYVMMGSGSSDPGIYVYAPDGALKKYYPGEEYADLAIDGAGNLYLSNIRKGQVELKPANGSPRIFWREDTPGRFIDYIAAARDGTLYVTDFNVTDNPAASVGGRILKIGPDGAIRDVIEGSPELPMTIQFKLSVSDNGTVYLADSGVSVGAIYPDGGRSSITPAGVENGRADRLVDVAAGGDGYLYVTESTGGYVLKLAPDGRVMTKWDGCGPMRFATPFGVAVDGQGRVYVTDMLNQRVVWFDGDRYRFGDDASENVAGKGLLWDYVMDAGNVTAPPIPGYPIVPPHGMPGYTFIIAIVCLCLAGLLTCLRGRI